MRGLVKVQRPRTSTRSFAQPAVITVSGVADTKIASIAERLASVLLQEGSITEAAALHKSIFESHRERLGKSHAATIESAIRLAHSYVRTNDILQAESLHAETLTILEPEWGNTFITTLLKCL